MENFRCCEIWVGFDPVKRVTGDDVLVDCAECGCCPAVSVIAKSSITNLACW